MRKRIFIRCRRAYLRAGADLERNRPVKLKRAQRVQSYWDDFKHTASRRVRENLNAKEIKMICAGAIARARRKEQIYAS